MGLAKGKGPRREGCHGRHERRYLAAVILERGGGHCGLALVLSLSAVLAPVPPVLYSVVAAAVETSGNVGPPLANLLDHGLNDDAFLGRDGVVVESRLQVLVISFAALLWCSGAEGIGDAYPVQGALVLDQRHEVGVLMGRPRASSVVVRWGSHDVVVGVVRQSSRSTRVSGAIVGVVVKHVEVWRVVFDGW